MSRYKQRPSSASKKASVVLGKRESVEVGEARRIVALVLSLSLIMLQLVFPSTSAQAVKFVSKVTGRSWLA